MYGITGSCPIPILSMSIWVNCGTRSIRPAMNRSSRMCAAPASFCEPMFRLRLTSFRLAIAFGGTFFLCTAALFGLIYWQATTYLTYNFDGVIIKRAGVIAAMPPDRWIGAVQERVNEDSGRLLSAGLFSADGRRIAGNVASLPFRVVGEPRGATIVRIDPDGQHA